MTRCAPSLTSLYRFSVLRHSGWAWHSGTARRAILVERGGLYLTHYPSVLRSENGVCCAVAARGDCKAWRVRDQHGGGLLPHRIQKRCGGGGLLHGRPIPAAGDALDPRCASPAHMQVHHCQINAALQDQAFQVWHAMLFILKRQSLHSIACCGWTVRVKILALCRDRQFYGVLTAILSSVKMMCCTLACSILKLCRISGCCEVVWSSYAVPRQGIAEGTCKDIRSNNVY